MEQAPKRRGRPPIRADETIKIPLPFKVLVKGILDAGPHPASKAKKKANAAKARLRKK